MTRHQDHVCIIGAGVIGLCTAFQLVEQGTRVTLVENASQGIAQGASGYAGGFIGSKGWHSAESTPLAELSWREHVRMAGKLDGAKRYGWRLVSALGVRVGETNSSRSAYRKLPEQHARPVNEGWLNSDDQEDLTGDGGVGQVDPDLFCQVILQYVLSHGASIVYGEPMYLKTASNGCSLEIKLRGPDVLTTVTFDRLLLSAGPWTARLCETLNLPSVPIHSLPGHSLLIQPREDKMLPAECIFAGISTAFGVNVTLSKAGPLSDAEKKQGFTRAPELFVRPSGLVYVAGENSTSSAGELPETVDDVKGQLDEKLSRRLARAAALVSDDLNEQNGAKIIHKQFCYRPITTDGLPILDKLADRVWVASGHGPWGITLAPGTGKVMAEMLTSDTDSSSTDLSADVSQLGLARF